MEGEVKRLDFDEELYFPTSFIIDYERKLVKSSLIWEIIEEKRKQ